MASPPGDTPSASPDGAESRRLFLLFGFIAGALTIVTLAAILVTPSPSPSDQLASFNSHTRLYEFLAAALLFVAIGATPFVASLGSALAGRGRGLVWSAMLLTVLGLFTLAMVATAQVSALWAIANTSAPLPALPAYEASLWTNFIDEGLILGLFAWGLGQLLFGVAAWNSRVLPNWLAIVGVIGGLAGWIVFLPGVGFFIVIALPVSFAIWCFASPIVFHKGSSAPGA